jgi:protein mago nashi
MARYANNSNYRNDSLIRKESMFCLTPLHAFSFPTDRLTRTGVVKVCVSSLMIKEIKRIIKESEIMK